MNPLRTTASAPNFHRFVHMEIVKHDATHVYTVKSGRLPFSPRLQGFSAPKDAVCCSEFLREIASQRGSLHFVF
jgi:hypothetical protein